MRKVVRNNNRCALHVILSDAHFRVTSAGKGKPLRAGVSFGTFGILVYFGFLFGRGRDLGTSKVLANPKQGSRVLSNFSGVKMSDGIVLWTI